MVSIEDLKKNYENSKKNNEELFRYVVCIVEDANMENKIPIWRFKSVKDAIEQAEYECLMHGIIAVYVDLEKITV